jgi:hypothetical protein
MSRLQPFQPLVFLDLSHKGERGCFTGKADIIFTRTADPFDKGEIL